MLGRTYEGQDCALAAALEVLGERWTLLVLRDAFFGVRRFSDFAARLELPRAVLSDRLRRLVEEGVLERVNDPPGYALTPAGEELWPAVYALLVWGSRHRRPSTRRYLHAPCEVELDAGGRCPACGELPPARDVEMVQDPRRATRTDPASRQLTGRRRLLTPVS